MSSERQVSSGGIGFVGVLTILFIALKLSKHLDWSWVWVLSPLWISVAATLAIAVLFVLAAFLSAALIASRRPGSRRY